MLTNEKYQYGITLFTCIFCFLNIFFIMGSFGIIGYINPDNVVIFNKSLKIDYNNFWAFLDSFILPTLYTNATIAFLASILVLVFCGIYFLILRLTGLENKLKINRSNVCYKAFLTFLFTWLFITPIYASLYWYGFREILIFYNNLKTFHRLEIDDSTRRQIGKLYFTILMLALGYTIGACVLVFSFLFLIVEFLYSKCKNIAANKVNQPIQSVSMEMSNIAYDNFAFETESNK